MRRACPYEHCGESNILPKSGANAEEIYCQCRIGYFKWVDGRWVGRVNWYRAKNEPIEGYQPKRVHPVTHPKPTPVGQGTPAKYRVTVTTKGGTRTYETNDVMHSGDKVRFEFAGRSRMYNREQCVVEEV